MNSENSRTTEPNILVLKLTNTLYLIIGKKFLPSQILEFITHAKT